MALSFFTFIGLSFSLLLLIKIITNSDYKLHFHLSTITLIFIISLELFFGWLIISENFYHFPHLIRVNTPFVFLIGPAVYFFVISRIDQQLTLHYRHLLHLIPFLLIVIYFIPVFAYSRSAKLEYIQDMYAALSTDSYLVGGLRRIHQSGYFIAAFSLFLKKRTKIIQTKTRNSTLFVLTLFCIFLLVDIYRYFFWFDMLSGMVDTILLSVLAIVLVYLQLSSPKNIAYKKSGFDLAKIQYYEDRILTILNQEKLYLNPKLSLPQLAKSIDTSPQLTSQIINQKMRTNFNELINKYRVEEAIKLLQDSGTKHLTIEAIAGSAGFNSVSSFNANFKRIAGKPPKYYRDHKSNN